MNRNPSDQETLEAARRLIDLAQVKVRSCMLFAYVGPETVLPLTSILAAGVGVLLMFGRQARASAASPGGTPWAGSAAARPPLPGPPRPTPRTKYNYIMIKKVESRSGAVADAPFPLPAHRTIGQEFPSYGGLDENTRLRPRKSSRTVAQADEVRS